MARGRSKRGWAVLAVVPALLELALAAACSLPSTAEFSGGKALGSEAGVDAAAGPDGAGAAAAFDGGSDAAPEAGTEAGMVACPATAVLCEQFEGSLDGWSTHVVAGTAVTGDSASGKALIATVGEHTNDHTEAYLERAVGLSAKQPFTLSFDLNVSTLKGVGIVDLDYFRTYPPFLRLGLRIAGYGSGFFVHYYGDPVGSADAIGDDIDVTPFVAGQWLRTTLTVTYPDGKIHCLLRFDGDLVWEGDVDGKYAAGKVYVDPGIATTEAAGGPITVKIDNIVVTSP